MLAGSGRLTHRSLNYAFTVSIHLLTTLHKRLQNRSVIGRRCSQSWIPRAVVLSLDSGHRHYTIRPRSQPTRGDLREGCRPPGDYDAPFRLSSWCSHGLSLSPRLRLAPWSETRPFNPNHTSARPLPQSDRFCKPLVAPEELQIDCCTGSILDQNTVQFRCVINFQTLSGNDNIALL